MGRGYKGFIYGAALRLAVCVAHAAEIDADAEKHSLLPLVPESTYTYNWQFKDRKASDTLILKSARVADTDVFFFVTDKEAGAGVAAMPNPIICTNSIGRGVYVKANDGIATLYCFSKNEINAITRTTLSQAVTIIRTAPESGAIINVPVSARLMNHTYKVEGREDVTVPAGTFKECLKLTIEEIHIKKPPEQNIVYTATAWLAPGVGLVKWIRGTGRVDELAAYKLGETAK